MDLVGHEDSDVELLCDLLEPSEKLVEFLLMSSELRGKKQVGNSPADAQRALLDRSSPDLSISTISQPGLK